MCATHRIPAKLAVALNSLVTVAVLVPAEDLDVVVTALRLILDLEGEECQVDVTPDGRFDRPVAVGPVVVVVVAVPRVRVKVLDPACRLKVSAAHCWSNHL